MEKEWIYRNIDKLKTPVGWFSVYSGDKKIPFSVVRNGFDVPSEVVDDDGNVLGTIHTESNYAIVLETRDLELADMSPMNTKKRHKGGRIPSNAERWQKASFSRRLHMMKANLKVYGSCL